MAVPGVDESPLPGEAPAALAAKVQALAAAIRARGLKAEFVDAGELIVTEGYMDVIAMAQLTTTV